MTAREKTALITGANRGLGLEIARQLGSRGIQVILTSRDGQKGRAALDELRVKRAEHLELDVTKKEEIEAVARAVKERHGGLDIYVANAAISLSGFDARVAKETIETNFFGALNTTDALLPLMREDGRIVLLSSGMGDRSILGPKLRQQFSEPLSRNELVRLMSKFVDNVAAGVHKKEGWPSSAYSVSKIGLTALAGALSAELAAASDPRRILVNAACPGWVRTDMGGRSAPRSVEDGADTPVWLALLQPGGPTGGIFRDRKPAEW